MIALQPTYFTCEVALAANHAFSTNNVILMLNNVMPNVPDYTYAFAVLYCVWSHIHPLLQSYTDDTYNVLH